MRTILFITAALLLAGCSAEDPKDVAREYWQAMIDGDTETARSLVSSDSQPMFDAHVQAINTPDKLVQVALDDQRTVVITTINPNADKPWRDRPFETVMVLEDGRWKIHIDHTRVPPPTSDLERQLEDMANDLDGTVEDNLNTMEDMLDEGMKLLDESIEQGSREMSDSFSRAMRKLQDAMRDSVEKMKQRRQEMQQDDAEPVPPADPAAGEGVI